MKKIYDLKSLNFLYNANIKVGILGGSFNPAHKGHLYISLRAINYYHFDYVVWLVANQNPFKKAYVKDIITRSRDALLIANHPKIIISNAEKDLKVKYAYDALKILMRRYSKIKFSWLMGVDNIKYFHKWHRFEQIIRLLDIIIFDRPCNSRYVQNTSFCLNYKTVLDKKSSPNIVFDKGVLHHAASSKMHDF